MATEVKLPSLGEGVASGDVLEIFVKEGEVVSKDQALLEVETDKATVNIPSPSAGKITKILVKEGETVAIGGAMFLMEGTSAPPAAQTPPPAPAVATPVPAAPAEVTPSPKATTPVAVPTPTPTPVIQPIQTSPTSTPPILAPVPVAAQVIVPTFEGDLSSDVIPAGPAIRRFAREVGVELSQVTGTGDGGRITREDVLAVVRQTSHAVRTSTAPQSVATAPVNASNSAPSSPSKTSDAKGATGQDEYGPIRVEKMAKIRKTIAAQMHKSWSTVPRVVNFDDADVTELEAFRQSSKDDYASRGIKLTTMPFLIKAVATALKHHPAINAVIDVENEQIIYKEYVNIGIAIDTERGLIVPTLKSADKMPIPDIAKALSELSGRVRNNDFAVSELRGGTFTISNLGAIGGTYSTPIVNVPEVAILLVGRSRKLPVVMEDDSIKARLMMPLSLAYDHRLVDGGTAARFLNDVIAYLEAPSRLLLAI